MRDKLDIIEVICPRCHRIETVYLPFKAPPRCAACAVRMVLKERLDEKIRA